MNSKPKRQHGVKNYKPKPSLKAGDVCGDLTALECLGSTGKSQMWRVMCSQGHVSEMGLTHLRDGGCLVCARGSRPRIELPPDVLHKAAQLEYRKRIEACKRNRIFCLFGFTFEDVKNDIRDNPELFIELWQPLTSEGVGAAQSYTQYQAPAAGVEWAF